MLAHLSLLCLVLVITFIFRETMLLIWFLVNTGFQLNMGRASRDKRVISFFNHLRFGFFFRKETIWDMFCPHNRISIIEKQKKKVGALEVPSSYFRLTRNLISSKVEKQILSFLASQWKNRMKEVYLFQVCGNLILITVSQNFAKTETNFGCTGSFFGSHISDSDCGNFV